VLVASPRKDTVEEATYFADKLQAKGIVIAGLVVNRVHPSFGVGDPAAARAEARAHAGSALGELWENLADFREVAARESVALAGLAEQVAPAPVVAVPFLRTDVHDLHGLDEIGSHLFDGDR
jgi:anion-transporting  ArsA/GET3 family ATPase